ncbi:hypothetical protein, partial [Klebsiella pneumoniae]|uniref:hypothetical protein n=1 Tax=Klebsiella pneumoniae TaxID=573 RepID=UPI001BE07865
MENCKKLGSFCNQFGFDSIKPAPSKIAKKASKKTSHSSPKSGSNQNFYNKSKSKKGNKTRTSYSRKST